MRRVVCRYVQLACALLICGLMCGLPLRAAPSAGPAAAAPPGEVKRVVIALYHGTEEAAPDQTRIHKFLEMPFNHLGYSLSYWDLKNGLPPPALTAKAAAVATWFGEQIPDNRAFLDWANKTAQHGVRFVMLESTAAAGHAAELPAINALLAHLGIAMQPGFVANTASARIAAADREIVAFERPLSQPLQPFPLFSVVAPVNGAPPTNVHLSATRADAAGEAVFVTTSAGGGFIAAGHAIAYDPRKARLAWLIDPIAFLQKAMGAPLMPVPDTTTLAGRRIYFSHIDGDGWNNPTHITGAASPGAETQSSAAVVLKELIAPYPDLPVTIGLISCDIDPALGGRVQGADIARQLYALPQVEAASHTHTHPFDWPFYANYSRAKEMAILSPPPPPAPRPLAAAPVSAGYSWPWDTFAGPKPIAAPPRPIPRPAPKQAPRASTKAPFDLSQEVSGSLGIVRSLLPPDKRPELYLWSGDTRPFEAAVRATRQANVRNMNGGDARLDADYPSLAYIPPLSRVTGGQRQIYAVNSNENTYTNQWKGPFDGFAKLTETHARTELPRRLKPVNVYYHMYSGERAASLAAVKAHLDRARAAPVIPIAASQYAAIADSFFDVALTALAPRRWRIENRGDLHTVRFDAAEALDVDLAASAGVLGMTRHAGGLYVALDPAFDEPEVALMERSGASPHRPFLVESRWQLSALEVAPCEIAARAIGFGPGQMTWAGLAPGRYRAVVRRTAGEGYGEPAILEGIVAGDDGRLTLSIDADARAGVMLRLICAAAATTTAGE